MKSLKNDKSLLPIFFVAIESAHKNRNKLCKIHYIEQQIWMYIEAYKGKGFKQCYNCQRYTPFSWNCPFRYLCLKYGANHATADCRKQSSTPVMCCNCGGPHPTDFGNALIILYTKTNWHLLHLNPNRSLFLTLSKIMPGINQPPAISVSAPSPSSSGKTKQSAAI